MISGFGKWGVRSKHPRRGRNPRTSEQMLLHARRVVTWGYSPVLKKAVNGAGKGLRHPLPQMKREQMMSRRSRKKEAKGTKASGKLMSRLKKQELFSRTKFVGHKPGEENMSEVLMDFVDPYTVHAGTEEQWRKPLGVAVIA